MVTSNSTPLQKISSATVLDEIFIIDFISIRETNETIEKAEIKFPSTNQYIIINGEKCFFNTYYIRDEGMSSDNLYHRIATPDFKFWVCPKDYKRFIAIINHRHDILIQNRQKRDERDKKDITISFEYSAINEDIYKCFISNKTGMRRIRGRWCRECIRKKRLSEPLIFVIK